MTQHTLYAKIIISGKKNQAVLFTQKPNDVDITVPTQKKINYCKLMCIHLACIH